MAIPEQAVAALRRNPHVVAVDPDTPVTTSATQPSPPWGLDRIDQRALPLSGSYTYPSDGNGVTAYVIDTGILASHVDFGGRVRAGFSAINEGRGTVDCNGHGTHVTGTLAGNTYGVAKGARPVAVRVLDCSGSGSTSGVIAGLDLGPHRSRRGHPGRGQPEPAWSGQQQPGRGGGRAGQRRRHGLGRRRQRHRGRLHGRSSYVLSFWLRVTTAETTTTGQNDRLTVTFGTSTLATYTNLDKSTGYLQRTVNVTGQAGKTAILKFAATENRALQTTFAIDDTALTVA
jgi:hypothetical protein